MYLKPILEEFKDGIKFKGQYYEIFSNPSSKELKEIINSLGEDDDGVRAVMTINGVLYTAVPHGSIIHDTLLEMLNKKGVTKSSQDWWKPETSESYKKFLCVISDSHNINDWLLSESYYHFTKEEIPQEYLDKYIALFSKQGKNLITKKR